MSSANAISQPNPTTTLKLLLIGASSVGKSSLLLRFTDEIFLGPDETTATIGVDYKVKLIEKNGKRYKLTIWDTAGQERFRTLTSSYYRGAMGVLLIYDVTNRESFDSLNYWFNELETFTSSDVIKCIVGNKTDREFNRVVSLDQGQTYAENKNSLFFETSAKQGRGVEEIFDKVIEKILENPALYETPPGGFKNRTTAPGSYPTNVNLNEEAEGGGWGCMC